MIFAMSKHNLNASRPRIFRSYQGPANQLPDCTIWEALRAAMAHPDFFKGIEIGEPSMRESFIGGDLGCSNPIAHVLSEVSELYPGQHVASIVSIGAGHARTIHIPKPNPFQQILPTNVLVAMKNIATDSERVAEDMAMRFQDTPNVYFRFSVDQGMQNVAMSQWQRLGEVVAHTRAYMQKVEVTTKMSQASQAIKEGKAALGTAYISKCIHCEVFSLPFLTLSHQQMEKLKPLLCSNLLALSAVRHHHPSSQDVSVKSRRFQHVSSDRLGSTAYVWSMAWEALGKHRSRFKQSREPRTFDNTDDPDLGLPSLFPQGSHGSILITTRLRSLALLGQGPNSACNVGGMDPQEGLELLLKKA
jgi:hypothetical protein